jgi:D-psicose/D-tagatose/L-ribulose 3-epimerase
VKLALCNEVLQPMPFARQCEYAAQLGYDGLEVAPFTLGEPPEFLDTAARVAVRRAAADAGVRIYGLHWLLVVPRGLSITSPDAGVRTQTIDMIRRAIDLCADLGGAYLVHGSPAQRMIPPGDTYAIALTRAMECWTAAAAAARAAGVTYCIEALARAETDFVNTIAEAAAIVDSIGQPSLKTMLDCCAASQSETEPIPALLDRWMPSGHIAHVQVNDRNRRGPGEGDVAFAPILAALRRNGYDGVVAVEPFHYVPDGPACAARAAGYLRGILQSLP